MLRLSSFVRFALLALFASCSFAAEPFPHEASDLTPDPAIRFGTLPNGFRYAIRANQEPKGRASFRLLVKAGSLHETEDQRGLAHFLEHMAFNGSTHYAPGTLVEFFQRMGMSFGADTNAYTSFDRTVYMLELPDTEPKTVREGTQVFSDYAGGLLLLESEVERERGIILSERRTRDSVGFRTFVAQFEFVLGGTRFPQRIPIGVPEVISSAGRTQFLDFYDTWYRPERMAVVVVGDIDVEAVEQEIKTTFSTLAPRAPARPDPELGQLRDGPPLRVHFHREPEAPATTVAISAITPYEIEPDTAAVRLKYLPRDLALGMLNRRLSILAKQEDATFTSGSTSAAILFRAFREASMELTCRPAQWAEALATAEQELRRALEHGFQESELREVVANTTNALEQAVRRAATRRSEGLAGEIVDSLVDEYVVTTPADDLALFQPALAKVTPEDCLAAFREAWSTQERYLMVSGNTDIAGDAQEEIVAAYQAANAVAVTLPTAVDDLAWGYSYFGPPGEVEARRHVDDLDVTLVTFSNGVRLNLKRTDFEANRIRLSVRIGTGELTEPNDKPGLAFYSTHTLSPGGLGKHSSDDLQRLLAGKTVGFGFRVAADALSIGASTHQDDLLLQLQLIAAYLTDAGYRPEAARLMQKAIEQFYTSLEHTPNGPLQTVVPRLLAGGDQRFGYPPKEVAFQRTLDEVKEWLTPQFAGGPIEIAMVGDLDLDATIEAVAQTFGALVTRSPKPPLTKERAVSFPAEPLARTFRVPTTIPKGIVALFWPTTDASDVQRTRRLTLLGEVFNDRLRVKVREELGGAYSPGAGNNSSDTYSNYGYMMANVTVDPAAAEPIVDTVVEIAADLHAHGVTEEELERARRPILTSLRESARTNGYWLGAVLARAQEKPEVLDWARTRYSDNEAITKAELDALAKEYLSPERVFRFIVLPELTETAPTPEP